MTTSTTAPIRILHVVAGMDRGGLETWLMNVFRRMDRERFRFDFCTGTDRPCDHDDEIRALGGEILPCLGRRNLWHFEKRFGRILRERTYDIVHAHPYGFSGEVLRVAARAGVSCRLAHLHTTGDGCASTPVRMLYRRAMRFLVRRYATGVLGCSRSAFQSFFGPGWQKDRRMRVIYYGVDMEPFNVPAQREGVRRELTLPPETKLMLHVGRFVEAKNHHGLIELFREIPPMQPEVHLLLVGEGELLDEVRHAVEQYGLQDRVHFLGVRADVARLMKASDIMVMPSVREGIPLTMLEAMAAGLPVVITDMPGIREAHDVCAGATLLSLDQSYCAWGRVVGELLEKPRPDPAAALARMKASPFSSEASARTMEEVYSQCVAQGPAAGQVMSDNGWCP